MMTALLSASLESILEKVEVKNFSAFSNVLWWTGMPASLASASPQ